MVRVVLTRPAAGPPHRRARGGAPRGAHRAHRRRRAPPRPAPDRHRPPPAWYTPTRALADPGAGTAAARGRPARAGRRLRRPRAGPVGRPGRRPGDAAPHPVRGCVTHTCSHHWRGKGPSSCWETHAPAEDCGWLPPILCRCSVQACVTQPLTGCARPVFHPVPSSALVPPLTGPYGGRRGGTRRNVPPSSSPRTVTGPDGGRRGVASWCVPCHPRPCRPVADAGTGARTSPRNPGRSPPAGPGISGSAAAPGVRKNSQKVATRAAARPAPICAT